MHQTLSSLFKCLATRLRSSDTHTIAFRLDELLSWELAFSISARLGVQDAQPRLNDTRLGLDRDDTWHLDKTDTTPILHEPIPGNMPEKSLEDTSLPPAGGIAFEEVKPARTPSIKPPQIQFNTHFRPASYIEQFPYIPVPKKKTSGSRPFDAENNLDLLLNAARHLASRKDPILDGKALVRFPKYIDPRKENDIEISLLYNNQTVTLPLVDDHRLKEISTSVLIDECSLHMICSANCHPLWERETRCTKNQGTGPYEHARKFSVPIASLFNRPEGVEVNAFFLNPGHRETFNSLESIILSHLGTKLGATLQMPIKALRSRQSHLAIVSAVAATCAGVASLAKVML